MILFNHPTLFNRTGADVQHCSLLVLFVCSFELIVDIVVEVSCNVAISYSVSIICIAHYSIVFIHKIVR